MTKRLFDSFLALATTAALFSCDGFSPEGGIGGQDIDASPESDAPVPEDIGEDISLPPGWSAEVFFDFSDKFIFDPEFFVEEGTVYNNRPHRLVLFEAPFQPGLGLVTSTELIEVGPPNTYVVHDYFRVLGNTPDVIFDAEPCAEVGPGALTGICLGAGSPLGGDGVFVVLPDFAISQISTANNVAEVVVDQAGLFDGTGVPKIYVGGPNGLGELGQPVLVGGSINGAFMTRKANGDMLVVSGLTDRTLHLIPKETTDRQTLASVAEEDANFIGRQNVGAIAIAVGGDIQFPGIHHLVLAAKKLVSLAPDGSVSLVAETDPDDDWQWTHVVIPPVDHPLGDPLGAFYILEFNPTLGIDRILRIGPVS